jgi:hypothetical protein
LQALLERWTGGGDKEKEKAPEPPESEKEKEAEKPGEKHAAAVLETAA